MKSCSVLAYYEGYCDSTLYCAGNYTVDVSTSGEKVAHEVCQLIVEGVKANEPKVNTVLIKHVTIFPHG